MLVSTEVQTYTYVYNGGSLAQEVITTTVTTDDGATTATQTLDFAYDADGLPMSVTCNGGTYYYVTNLQGDVTDILDSSGTSVVTYTYNAWGNILTATGTMASTLGIANPLRYRGYYYDTETGFYYLQSRYYDPTICRFINADSFASTGQSALGYNMFAYCNNNPANCIDPNGKFSWLLALAIVAIIVLIPSDADQVPYYEAAATQKYNEDTINMSVGEIGTDPDKLNVTFYPEAGLIHIEESHSISSKYEKRAVIDVIMSSEHYDPTVYGNSADTMLMEWSGHNFLYHTASSSSVAYGIYQRIGYETPIESTRGVDFRKQLAPSAERNYKIITLWGLLQW